MQHVPETRGERGQAMIAAVMLFSAVVTTVVLGITSPIIRQVEASHDLQVSKQSYFAAESVAEDMAYRLKSGKSVGSSESLTVGGASVSANLASDMNGQTITATGNDNNLVRIVKLSLSQGSGVAFNYGVQAGEGGFVLTGGATINGNVYANGTITATNGVHINGSAVAADSAALSADQANTTPTPPTSSITFGNASGQQDLAQSFQVSTDGTLNQASFYLEKVGAPGNLTVRITSDSAGKPSSTSIVSATLASSLVTTSYGWVTVTFPSNISLQAGTTYWVVLDGGNNASKYYIAGANTSYGSGTALVGSFGGSWGNTSPAGLDAYFQIYLGGFTSMIGGDTYIGGVAIQNDAWANKVQGASVSGNLYCQTGLYNNKSCNTSRSDPTPQAFPVSDGNIADWKAQASAGGVFTGDKSIGSSGATLGPLKINGNLTVGGGGTLTVAGTLWVTGSVSVAGGAKVKLASSYGSNSGVIVADGTVSLGGGGELSGSGTSGSYLMILTTSNCPFDSSCASTPAITLSGGATSVILNAQSGSLQINGGATLNAATAYQISASGGATLNYSSGLANLFFTSGPSGGYTISTWQESQ